MNRPFYRDSRLVAAHTVNLSVAKTLGSTGELDLWSGSGALVHPAGGELSIVSSSAQDTALVFDTWTLSGEEGSDFASAFTLDGVTYGGLGLTEGADMTALDAAMANGSKEVWGVQVAVVPDPGDVITIAVAGGASYPLTITTEVTVDDVTAALATLMAADPTYDVLGPTGAGAVVAFAKVPNTNTGNVSVTLSDTGDATAIHLVTHGPACTTHTATVVEGTLVIVANTAGVAHELVADTDTLSAVHTLTGGEGTGCQRVRVHYITATGIRRTEDLALEGLVPVTTNVAHSVFGLLGCESLAGTAAGTISIKRFGDATTVATIAVGDSEIHRLYAATGSGSTESFTCTGMTVTNGSGTVAAIRLRATGPAGSRLLGQWAAGIGTNLDLSFGDSPIVLGPSETLRATAEGNGAVLFVALQGYYAG